MGRIVPVVRGLARPRIRSPLLDARGRAPLANIIGNLWLSRAGVTNSGGVTAWAAINSGATLTSAAPPVFTASDSANSKPAVSFNGSTHKMKLPANTIAAAAGIDKTVFVVRRCNNANGNALFLFAGGAENYMSSTTAGRAAVATTSFFGGGVGIPVEREICCEIFRIKSGVVEYWRDGYFLGTASMSTVSMVSNDFWLCVNNSGGSNFGANDIFAFGVEKRAISNQEIADVNYWVQASTAQGGEGYIVRFPVATNTQTGSIMLFGDSMTAANTNNNDGNGLNLAYREIIASRFPKMNFVGTITAGGWTHHEGVGGNKFADMQARLAAALAANPNPNYMLVQGGTNDAAALSDTIDTAMKSFIQAAYALSPNTQFLLTDPPLYTGTSAAQIQPKIAAYWGQIDAAIAVLQGLGIKIARVTSGSLLVAGDLGADGTHPNITGYMNWCHYIEPVIRQYLT